MKKPVKNTPIGYLNHLKTVKLFREAVQRPMKLIVFFNNPFESIIEIVALITYN
ncbi:hypothetical protein SAMN05421640_3678 [Ekhidna lutea]|uniref:Uncharacterized protein n=1 Tax=Ekhidna lutea TaxID=447679 RepID=A0A239M947_EKHLU|nr:hypothetical protein SAMN05421640_3678 [Ekhidna lutea]